MLGLPPEAELYWANEVRTWAIIMAVIGGGIGLAAGYLQIRLQAEISATKNEAFRRFEVEAHERIAQAQAETARASETAAHAQQRASELSIQAEKVRLEAEQARLENESLRARFAWRRISSEQRGQIAAALRAANLRPAIFVTTSDPEAAQFRADLVATLREAGDQNPNWRVAAGSSTFVGLSVQGPKEQERSILASLFEQAGFPMQNAGQAERLTIVIGTKPPPF
jgi:hypothetical protein